ncbi:MAG: hypothetical protein QOG60_868, partial [Frankiaceae bacterium]|nr:hypothetical protein [Frankiaceae bacterium]
CEGRSTSQDADCDSAASNNSADHPSVHLATPQRYVHTVTQTWGNRATLIGKFTRPAERPIG